MYNTDEELQRRVQVCPVCKKEFFLPMFVSKSDYVYTIYMNDPKSKQKIRKRCCSYSCYRKATN